EAFGSFDPLQIDDQRAVEPGEVAGGEPRFELLEGAPDKQFRLSGAEDTGEVPLRLKEDEPGNRQHVSAQTVAQADPVFPGVRDFGGFFDGKAVLESMHGCLKP